MDESSVYSKMQEVLDLVTSDVASIRTGRATSTLIDNLSLNVYGGQQKLKVNELGSISVPDSQTLLIEPWDKSIIGEIRQGILAANIGLNPVISGTIIRISLPVLTTEDRQNYIRLLRTKLENGRIMVRQIRGNFMHYIKKSFEGRGISEDEKFNLEKRLQEITDEFIEEIEALGKKKEEELMQI
ncbi:ribosome recycling factor [Candidatus Woesebacteria bacterium RIFCSPLOWO2_01_FULL_39_10b]|uniref:Ribosome recycling factor n=1 Tax=Candidatus Woesebacteria bacterium RIFCSPLOWO2_01_FULL_39_10b TaxID=1802517 RepID=A0A1F8B7C6_9BACT|nr:MAG: ribosome recycling factor [Candidatus Woesebacteria bacterium RIFCSPLOWO2_01_FULL_39_10b]